MHLMQMLINEETKSAVSHIIIDPGTLVQELESGLGLK